MSIPESGYELVETVTAPTGEVSSSPSKTFWIDQIAFSLACLLCCLHGLLIYSAMGKWAEISSDWPLLQADHGIHYRHGLLSGQFLRAGGTTAGYDPGFMSGYPMSIISDLSSTFSDLAMMTS